ncbi:MAG: amidohydrolase family protein [Microbacteriaceae bacterium]|nr:MAG: amidohydrolase family protein [Microbacteriaceae bacterium]
MFQFYTAGLLLTGESWEPVRQSGVLVRGGKIEWIGPTAELENKVEGTEVEYFDFGSAATIMPGLIDSHVHLVFDGGPNPVEIVKHSNQSRQLAIMLRSARELLSVGVTTARDLGAPAGLDVVVRTAIEDGLARGPRLVTAGAPLTVTGGHCWFFGGECDGVEGVRRQVRQARKAGADCIKVMATGGVLTTETRPWRAQFADEELAAIVDEAHQQGMLVAAHAHGIDGIRRAVNAGVDSLEHFSFMDADGEMHEDIAVVETVAAQGIYVCKTISTAWTEWMHTPGLIPNHMLRSLADRGVMLVAGTDAGIDGAPHSEYVAGLEGMAWFGLTNREVLDAATVSAAQSLGLGNVTGSLAPGKRADLIVVEGNPVDNISALRHLTAVIAGGDRYVPEFTSRSSWSNVLGGVRVPGLAGHTLRAFLEEPEVAVHTNAKS